MRCPKCQYISFDSGDRCRNCGYEFSLAADEPAIDVNIGRDEPRPGRIDDFSLTALDTPLSGGRQAPDLERDLDPAPASRRITAADLPLFTERFADDQAPLVSPPAVPRQPLSVRRGSPRPRNPLPEELALEPAREPRGVAAPRANEDVQAPTDVAGIVRRAGAGLIDTCILAAIQAGVLYLTLRACELTPEQWRLLPLVPLVAFMLLLCGGYFILFTAAGGQTIGKMATGIRVVAVPVDEVRTLRVSFRDATIRTIASLGSILAVGAGFLPVLLSADRRAFHDRVAATRVILA